ncbi:DegV family protein [Culicoidibacter larvae]|uniref:DegV family EDD domain-containing protein n=1 Tax=Culicoidibacter larvae TaxID=2579976 RepID=A0A5R8QFL0_9FIRM|nr:DegV family protein [Culicoidibacter larvae]TLG75449.1 DegV family EDD domain-containing protein [Culicoidibacter larvae]
MKINYSQFYQGIIIGSKKIIENKNQLNQINVFPVADADTGSNLSETAKNITQYMSNEESIAQVFKSAARGAFIGARGNSGIIFAQFMDFCAKEMPDTPSIELSDFSTKMKQAVDNLYNYVIDPVEGTILTILRSWAHTLESYKQHDDFDEYIDSVIINTYATLQNTPELLPVLKKRGVVDSGAQGMFYFIEGLMQSFSKTNQSILTHEPKITENVIIETSDLADSDVYRYCCEFMLEKHDAITKEELANFGDSALILEQNDLVKVHIHSNNPDLVAKYLLTRGTITTQKVEDMQLQKNVGSNKKGSIAIITDSIADLPGEYVTEQQIFVIPLSLEINGQSYLDRLTIQSEDFSFMNAHTNQQPKSSLPSLYAIERTLDFVFAHYDEAIIITVSGKLSGTYKTLNQYVKKYSDKKIQVIDSKLNSGAQGLLVKKAVALREQGKDLETITNDLTAQRENYKILVALDTTKGLARSGRVSNTTASILKALNFKPIMSLNKDGEGIAFGASFSQAGLKKKILKSIAKENNISGINNYVILHANCPDKADQFAAEIEQLIGKKADYISNISPVVEATAGAGAIAVAYETEAKK